MFHQFSRPEWLPKKSWPSLGNVSHRGAEALKWLRENRADRHTSQELSNPGITDWVNREDISEEVEIHVFEGEHMWIYEFTFAAGIGLKSEK